MKGKRPLGANGGALNSVSARASSDPLASVRKVAEATAGLKSETGRLDAGRVAEAFGLSSAELAGFLGESRQTLSKTPDSLSLQPSLRLFERTARLRAVLSEADLRGPPVEVRGGPGQKAKRPFRGVGPGMLSPAGYADSDAAGRGCEGEFDMGMRRP
jgi:hypothetical protein